LYNHYMSLTVKQRTFAVEYIKDFNATQAAIRAGYSKKSAAVIGHENLTKPNIKEYLQELLATRMTADEVVMRLQAMATGLIPTRTIESSTGERKEYDVLGALDRMGRIHALFVDRQITEQIQGLDIIDDEDSQD